MQIRHAGTQDIPGIDRLLSQVLTVHHNGLLGFIPGKCQKIQR